MLLLAATFAVVACASNPPPPPAAAPVATQEPPALAPMDESAAPPTATTETPSRPNPECEVTGDCLKSVGEPPAGSEWTCESGLCASHALPEAPKPEPAAEAPKDPKPAKKGSRQKKGN
jgi:hypothetical protein